MTTATRAMTSQPQSSRRSGAPAASGPRPSGVTASRTREIRAANGRRGLFLLGGFTGLALLVGAALTPLLGPWALAALVALGLLGVAAAQLLGGRVALAVAGAHPAHGGAHPRYHNLVEGLAADAGMPVPALAVIDDDALNALAVTHGSTATVAVTTGLLEELNRLELEGVLAHELSVISSRAARVRSAAVLVGGLAALCWYRRGPGAQALWALPAVLAWPLAPLTRLVAAARGQVEADELAAYLTRYPPGLAGALDKTATSAARLPTASRGIAHLWLVPPHSAPGPRWLATDPAWQQLDAARRITLLGEL